MKIKVVLQNGKAGLYTPYDARFVYAIKRMCGRGAKWDGKAWWIPEEALDKARDIMRDIYGECDLPEVEDRLKLRVTFLADWSEVCDDVTAFGRVFAHAWDRDGGARVGDNVILERGRITSGGSRRYWESIVKKGAVFTLLDVTHRMYEEYKGLSIFKVEVLDDRPAELEKLLEEREAIIRRLEEIEARIEAVEEDLDKNPPENPEDPPKIPADLIDDDTDEEQAYETDD